MEVSVYSDKTKICTLLKFLIIAQPMYEILNIIPLPTFNYDNKFTYTEIENRLIAINTETHVFNFNGTRS